MANAALLRCGSCELPFEPHALREVGGDTACPACGARSIIEIYPSVLRPPAPAHVARPVMLDSESSCFFHPTKQATVPCDRCGRFLCALCDFELEGEHLCASCLEAGRTRGDLQRLDNERTLYDHVAITATLIPLFFLLIPVLATGPFVLYLTVKHWKRMPGGIPRSRWRFVAANLISLVQAVLLMVFVLSMAGAFNV